MKISEVIQGALDNHYINGGIYGPDTVDKCEFMCVSVYHYIRAVKNITYLQHVDEDVDYNKTIVFIDKRLGDHGTLCGYMKENHRKYAGYQKRYGHDTPACFKLRQQFWEDLIAELQEKDM